MTRLHPLAPIACSCCTSALSGSGSFTIRRSAPEQRESLQRLAQIVARRGEETTLRLICAVGCLPSVDQLQLDRAAIRYVANCGGGQQLSLGKDLLVAPWRARPY